MATIALPNDASYNTKPENSPNNGKRVFGCNIGNIPVKIPFPKKAEPRSIDPIKIIIKNDPQQCEDYEEDIECCMRSLEGNYMGKPKHGLDHLTLFKLLFLNVLLARFPGAHVSSHIDDLIIHL